MISKQRPDVFGAPAIEPIRAKTSLCVYLFLHLFLSFPIQRYFPKCQPRYQVSLPLVFGNPLSLVPSLAPRNKVEENPWEQSWITTRTQSGWYNKNTSHKSQVTNAGH